MSQPIEVVDRASGVVFEEIVAGRKGLEFTISTTLGRMLLESVVKRRWFSKLYGWYQDSPLSKKSIPAFVDLLGIDMREAELDQNQYTSFNDFFIRTLKPEARPIDPSPERLALPADGRITAIESIQNGQIMQIKGVNFTLEHFLNDGNLASGYDGGSVIIVRLCPADYHRFHFPCDGTPSPAIRVAGDLYSVNPLAIQQRPGLFAENERQICLHVNHQIGRILLVDVGATMVGKIIQTYRPHRDVQKGEERGYFKFGGSTTVMIFPPGKIKIDEDLIQNSARGLETFAKMGEGFATIV